MTLEQFKSKVLDIQGQYGNSHITVQHMQQKMTTLTIEFVNQKD